jgi:hypothetical protein
LTKTEDPAFGPDATGPVDVVLLSYDQHADNLDPAGREKLSGAALTVTTASAASRLGGTARALASWDTLALDRTGGGTLEITAVPARHGPLGCETPDRRGDGLHPARVGLPTICVSGDNASLEIVKDIGQRIGVVDVALLFAGAARTSLFDGAPLTLTSADAAAAAALFDALDRPCMSEAGSTSARGPDDLEVAFAAAGLTNRLRIIAPGQSEIF